MRQTRVSIFVITAILISIGIVMVYSSSAISAYEKFNDSMFFLKRHIFYVFIGFVAAASVMSIDYIKIRNFATPLLIFSLILLILVFVPGVSQEIGGARRWLKIAGVNFQPSEFTKLALIIWLADFLTRRQSKITSLYHTFLPATLVLSIVVGTVLLQPDLGTAVALSAIAFAILFASGVRLAHLGVALLSAMPFLYFLIFNVGYRRARILAFFNPWCDPQGTGFQIIQSYLALGSGGIFGVGLGQSRQKLLYLPAAHTDFIFSIIGEETGFLGAGIIIILFILLIWQSRKVVLRTQDTFGRFLSLGITTMIGLEAMVNIGVSVGALPTKGLPLPFISYGGSALIFNMIAIGLLLNVARERSG
jgi:cell division protein FtsW